MIARRMISLCVLPASLTAAVHAQVTPAAHGSTQAAASAHLAVGVVRDVSHKGRTVSIAHQDIAGIMPAMTMSFRVDEGVSIASLKPGESVAFVLTSTAQGLVISSLQTVLGTVTGDSSHGTPGMQGLPHQPGGMAMMDQCREMMSRK